MSSSAARQLAEFLHGHPRVTVLSGAGCSTASGIPDYRDTNGEWKHPKPVQFADFVASAEVRQRYWARSYVGWQRMSLAAPNDAHYALAQLEKRGFIDTLITQNVDDLHRQAGSQRVVDLHGILRVVRCLDCDQRMDRVEFQADLERLNSGWKSGRAQPAPDGDAIIDGDLTSAFCVPDCSNCGGVLKPDVVFFGENVPAERVQRCRESLERSDALLVVGSSLMVYSGFRFARQAEKTKKPIVIVNHGRTRADELATRRFDEDCGELLQRTVECLAA